MAQNQDKPQDKPNKAAREDKVKSSLIDLTIQLTSLGNLQLALIRNMQKELKNLDQKGRQ
ncbi:MAG: hypothetical protein JW806_02950 [Sedimentisphaerales bacterium]|nr:hypothetical protein [Sedimentisphaerales bacterium]